MLICNEGHRFIVAEQMRQIGVEPAGILLEPIGRNTAPAVAVAALQSTAKGDDPLLLVLAADHVIRDAAAFRASVEAGRAAAEAGLLVTFGIVPTGPETGYGYIEAAEALRSEAPVPIARFVEKPDRGTAEQFLAAGRFTWNSGMFLFRASAILAELERLEPEVVSCCQAALDKDTADLDFRRLEREAFASCPSVAIDVAVMERTGLGTVLPLEAGWSDVGSWSALWETADQDVQGTVLRGRVISEGARNCYLRSEHRLVVGLGVEDLVVVETDDAVLIAHRDRAQDVRTIVRQLEAVGAREGIAHRRIYRPGGGGPGGRRNRRRGAGGPPRPLPGDQGRGRATGAGRGRRKQGASTHLPPLGRLRRHHRRGALAGEEDRGESRRQPVAADAPSPGRALGGGAGHRCGGEGRRGGAGGREPEHLHSAWSEAPPHQPGQDPGGDDRGAERALSG